MNFVIRLVIREQRSVELAHRVAVRVAHALEDLTDETVFDWAEGVLELAVHAFISSIWNRRAFIMTFVPIRVRTFLRVKKIGGTTLIFRETAFVRAVGPYSSIL